MDPEVDLHLSLLLPPKFLRLFSVLFSFIRVEYDQPASFTGFHGTEIDKL